MKIEFPSLRVKNTIWIECDEADWEYAQKIAAQKNLPMLTVVSTFFSAAVKEHRDGPTATGTDPKTQTEKRREYARAFYRKKHPIIKRVPRKTHYVTEESIKDAMVEEQQIAPAGFAYCQNIDCPNKDKPQKITDMHKNEDGLLFCDPDDAQHWETEIKDISQPA